MGLRWEAVSERWVCALKELPVKHVKIRGGLSRCDVGHPLLSTGQPLMISWTIRSDGPLGLNEKEQEQWVRWWAWLFLQCLEQNCYYWYVEDPPLLFAPGSIVTNLIYFLIWDQNYFIKICALNLPSVLPFSTLHFFKQIPILEILEETMTKNCLKSISKRLGVTRSGKT